MKALLVLAQHGNLVSHGESMPGLRKYLGPLADALMVPYMPLLDPICLPTRLLGQLLEEERVEEVEELP